MVQMDLTVDGIRKKSEFYKVVRMVQETDAEYLTRPNLVTPDQAADFIRAKISDNADECFGVIFLDTKHRPTGWAVVSNGTLSQCNVHPRNIFLPAFLSGAAAVIIFHNHPSGDPHPSREDIQLTEQVVKAGRLLGVIVLDHIVIAGSSSEFVSFVADGRMPDPK